LKLTLALTIPLFLLLAGCQKSAEQKAEAASPKPAKDPLAIQAGPDLVGMLSLGEPSTKAVQLTLRVAGRVEADETRIARVSAPLSGRITELDVVEGQMVKRGQVLAVIRSTELADAQFAYLKAFSQQQLADRAVSRAKRLVEAGVIGEAELQRRDAELVQANAEVNALHDQLRVLGMSEEEIGRVEKTRKVNSTIPVLASIDGTVMERKLTIGQMAQGAETIFVLADLTSVWLVADVPEQTAGQLEPGKSVEAEIAALPGRRIAGKLSFVSAIVNPETHTVRARMVLPNPKREYKPAMLATMTLQDTAERERVVPISAIVRENNQDHVFVQTGPDTFLMRRVLIGEEYGADRVLEAGVRPGEKIVLDGAFHLNNERKRLLVSGS
jgi:cobalt-zinc-cadmium efflux system membrane fusion protein